MLSTTSEASSCCVDLSMGSSLCEHNPVSSTILLFTPRDWQLRAGHGPVLVFWPTEVFIPAEPWNSFKFQWLQLRPPLETPGNLLKL